MLFDMIMGLAFRIVFFLVGMSTLHEKDASVWWWLGFCSLMIIEFIRWMNILFDTDEIVRLMTKRDDEENT